MQWVWPDEGYHIEMSEVRRRGRWVGCVDYCPIYSEL